MTEWRGESDCYASPIGTDRYYDYFTGEIRDRIPTPLDELGLVDRHQLIKLVLADAPPGHDWGDIPRDHHWQWDVELYPFINQPGRANPAIFRNLLINRTVLPLSVERRIHHTTWRPEVPDEEVMALMIMYGTVAKSLFESAKEIIKWQRRARSWRDTVREDPTRRAKVNGSVEEPKEIMKKNGGVYGMTFGLNKAKLENIPPEFRLVDTGGAPEQVIKDLNRLVGSRTMRLVLAQAA